LSIAGQGDSAATVVAGKVSAATVATTNATIDRASILFLLLENKMNQKILSFCMPKNQPLSFSQ
jgi:hypothetical protein